jgi:hypothetical protein
VWRRNGEGNAAEPTTGIRDLKEDARDSNMAYAAQPCRLPCICVDANHLQGRWRTTKNIESPMLSDL